MHEGYVSDNTDCIDTDENVNPDEEETWYNGIDNDCLGDDDYDQDTDGFIAYEYESSSNLPVGD